MEASKTREKRGVRSRSADPTEDRLAKLELLVPEAFCEGRLDFEKLRAALGELPAECAQRYGFSWAGKRECQGLLDAPSRGTLVPCPAASIDGEQTRNVFVEGDNLEVLKLLQESYAERVKLIYIDPPYNTGNDYVYCDDFADPLHTYLVRSGQKNAAGKLLTPNPEIRGRLHSAWLSMIYPRLWLARQLLRQDGAIFVSIDDHEVHNLRLLMDEVFGAENFVASLVWVAGRKNDSRLVSVSHEYILCYVRDAESLRAGKVRWRERKPGLDPIYAAYARIRRQHAPDCEAMTRALKDWYAGLAKTHPARQHAHYSWVDEQGIYFADNISWPGGGGPTFEILHPRTGQPCAVPSRGWMFARQETMLAAIAQNRVHFGPDERSVPCIKSYLRDHEHQVPYSVFYQDGRAATKRLRQLMGGDYFNHPKDESVLRNIIGFASQDDDIVLDFFAGSCSTAHAVLAANRADDGRRPFVMVQSPEEVPQDSAARKSGFATISQLGQERIRKVLAMFQAEPLDERRAKRSGKEDLGLQVFQFAPTRRRP